MSEIRMTENYRLITNNEFETNNYIEEFVKDAAFTLYITDDKQRVIGMCNAWDYFLYLKDHGHGYNRAFMSAASVEKGTELLKASGWNVLPVLMDGKLIAHLTKSFEDQTDSFFLGILMKFKERFCKDAVDFILRSFGIEKICLVQTNDSDMDILEYTKQYISKINAVTELIEISDLFNFKGGVREKTIFVDMGGVDTGRRIRRYMVHKNIGNQRGRVRYFFLEEFLNFLNHAGNSMEYMEYSVRNIAAQYGTVYLLGNHYWIENLSKIPDFGNNIIDISSDTTIAYSPEKECYLMESACDVNRAGMVLWLELEGLDAKTWYINGFTFGGYNLFLNTEITMLKMCADLYEELQKNEITMFIFGADGEIRSLWKKGIYSIAAIQGNDTKTQNTDIEIEKFQAAMGYTGIMGKAFAEEYYGISKKGVYRNTIKATCLQYCYSRHAGEEYDENKNTIFLFGCCVTGGVMAADADTLSAYLKRKFPQFNVCAYNSVYCHLEEVVEFYGTFKKGDIVLIMPSLFNEVKGPFTEHLGNHVIDFSNVFSEFADLEKNIWQSIFHCNHKVYRKIWECLEERIRLCTVIESDSASKKPKYVALANSACKYKKLIEVKQHPSGLQEYFAYLEQFREDKNNNGAIVMNCNPFTLGHLYLIETAASFVDILYVFVVEENKSEFPFKDRFLLVQEGCGHLDNVRVLSSGSFIISAVTLPGYFEKELLQDTILDASLDLSIFGKQIAPQLSIRKRFVGEEPFDKFTKQYNESMKKQLPGYGIEVEEIKRKEFHGKPISASLVWHKLSC